MKNVDDPCYVTLAVNPKEYFEFLKGYSSNKEHKGQKREQKEWILKITPKELNLLKI